jgi:hypothetical protein
MLLDVGETATELTTGVVPGVVTLTVAVPVIVGSATLIAVTTSAPALAGAVYCPEEEIEPSTAFHVTLVFLVEPWTTALNGSVPLVMEAAVEGETVTEVTSLPVFFVVDDATATIAVADLVGSALLVAVILPPPLDIGAVKTPLDVMVPIVVDQVTESFAVTPWIEALNCTLAPAAGAMKAGVTTTELTAGLVVEPLPVNGSIAGRCWASVMKRTVPVTAPVFAGANLTLNAALCPATSVIGRVSPDKLKPVPFSAV